MAILFPLALFSLGLTDIYRWIIDLRCHLQAFGRTHHWILSSNKSLDFGRCICIFIGDSTSSPSKLVFPSIFLFLGFYCPSIAHISSKEDLHVFLALTKSWKRGQFWCSSLHPTHNACFNFLWIKSGPKLLDFLALEDTFQALSLPHKRVCR